MKKSEVFEGNELGYSPVSYPIEKLQFLLRGKSPNGNKAFIPFDENLLSRHIMFLGGIGTGKTTAFCQMLSQLREKLPSSDVVIIFDTKGDFYDKYYRKGDIVISNDEKATGPESKDYWNIFNEIDRNDRAEETIIEISKSLFHEKIEKTTQPFFPNAAKDLFAAVLTHCSRANGEFTNHDLRDYFNSASADEIMSLLDRHPDLAAMKSYIRGEDSPQSLGVLSELQQVIREIFVGNFKKDGTLSMKDIVRAKGGRFVFIEYDLSIGNMLSPIYSLLFDLAIKEALSRKKTDGNVYFIADEFRLIPNLQHIDDAVNFGRSLGVKFMIGIQNIEQVFEAYGEERARSILSGFLTSICFRVADEASKKYIQELHGSNRKKEIFLSSIQGKGVVENIREALVVEDWDITRLEIGEAIIGLPGKPPFIFRFDPE